MSEQLIPPDDLIAEWEKEWWLQGGERFYPQPAVIAAVILAVRDYLLPEEKPLNEEEISDLVIWSRHRQRERLRAILTAEAERAESGE